MSDQLFVVLRVCLLALVYLVFLRVLRAVWVELRAESADAPAPKKKAAPARRPAPRPEPQPLSAATAAATASAATASGGGTSTLIGATPRRLVMVAPAALAGHTYPLDAEITIGRGTGCAVAIDDAHVSKLHARVFPDGNRWLVEDLGSTNGTMLNGDELTRPTPIEPGGRIRIGEIILELA